MTKWVHYINTKALHTQRNFSRGAPYRPVVNVDCGEDIVAPSSQGSSNGKAII